MIELRTLGTVALTRRNGAFGEIRLTQPKRLALLAYLALQSGRPARRDLLLALLWPDLDSDRARGALRQALHGLRRSLGDDVIVSHGDAELEISAEHLWCDGAAFERAVREQRHEDAMELYRGDLLPGLFISDAAEFERWIDSERTRFRELATRCAWALADAASARSDAVATHWARKAAALHPDSDASTRRLMEVLVRFGDRAGALHHYEAFAQRMRAELDADPAPETVAFAARLRAGDPSSPGTRRPHRPTPTDGTRRVFPLVPAASWARRWSWFAALALAAVGVVAWLGTARPALYELAGGSGPHGLPVQQAAMARGFFEEGLHRLDLGDPRHAERLFDAAVKLDSDFVPALYYQTVATEDRQKRLVVASRLARALRTAPDPDRLTMAARWALDRGETQALAFAETLAVRYPTLPDGQLLYARALVLEGRFEEAVPYLRRVIGMDSLAFVRDAVPCRACEAYMAIGDAFERMDSATVAVQWVRDWAMRQPRSARAWNHLSYLLAVTGQYGEAARARRVADDLNGRDDANARAEIMMRAGKYDAADDILLNRYRIGDRDTRESALFALWMSYRDQGRMREALQMAQLLHAASTNPPTDSTTSVTSRQYEAITLLEMGRAREAMAIAERISRLAPLFDPGSPARSGAARAGVLAFLATTRAAVGDTASLARLADSVQQYGATSVYARDRRLHHYVRGLLLEARGEFDRAAAEHERALWSYTGGYGAANVALGRSALAAGRADVAIRALGGVLRGPMAASGTSVNKSLAHALLARAFERAGEPDSARAHYRWVLNAWRKADGAIASRREEIRTRVDSLGRER